MKKDSQKDQRKAVNEGRPGYKHTPLGWIPEEWTVLEVGQIAKISSGGTPDRKNEKYWNGSIPWVTTSLIDFNTINHVSEFITDEGLKYSAAKLFEPGVILMAMYGQGKTRGKVAILGIRAATNQACAAIEVSEKVIVDFLYQYLKHNYINIRKLSNSGSQENLNGELIKSINIRLPGIHEQINIGKLLSTWDSAITKTQQLIEQLKRRNEGLMQELLTGKRRLKGHTVPWKSISLSQAAKITKGKALSSSGLIAGDIPVIAGGKSSPYFHNQFTDENVITISASGAYAGFVAYHGYKIWASDCSTVNGIPHISITKYLYYLLLFHQKDIYQLQTGGAQPHVYPKDLAGLHFYFPAFEEQAKIVGTLEAAFNEEIILIKAISQLEIQKKGLMQKLLTGEIRAI